MVIWSNPALNDLTRIFNFYFPYQIWLLLIESRFVTSCFICHVHFEKFGIIFKIFVFYICLPELTRFFKNYKIKNLSLRQSKKCWEIHLKKINLYNKKKTNFIFNSNIWMDKYFLKSVPPTFFFKFLKCIVIIFPEKCLKNALS